MEQNPYLEIFGQGLRDLRLARGLTQLELADKIKSGESTISRVEAGKHNPSLLWMIRVYEALDVDPKEFLDAFKKS